MKRKPVQREAYKLVLYSGMAPCKHYNRQITRLCITKNKSPQFSGRGRSK